MQENKGVKIIKNWKYVNLPLNSQFFSI